MDILISKNFKSDIAMLSSINRLCTVYAAELGVKPEQVELEIGKQYYRFVKFFNIAPQKPLLANALDFDSEIVCPIIVQGYRDARAVIQDYLAYECSRPARDSRQIRAPGRRASRRKFSRHRTVKLEPQNLYR